MGIIVAFFCGLCFYTLAGSIAEYISAKAHEIEANAQYLLKARNELPENQKGEN